MAEASPPGRQRLTRGGWVVCSGPDGGLHVVEDGAVHHVDGVIRSVGPYAALRAQHPDAEVTGTARHVVIPGLVNAHHHAFAPTTYRACSCDDPLELWLLDFFWRPTLDPYATTFLSALTLLESGVTTVLHCHYSKGSETRYEDEIPKAVAGYRDSGIRVSFGPEITDHKSWVYDRNGEFAAGLPEHLREAVAQFSSGDEKRVSPDAYFRLFEKWHAELCGDRVRLVLRPIVPHYCSDQLLSRMKDLSRSLGVGLHINIYETMHQRQYAQRLYNESAVRRLDRLALFDRRVSCAHGVWLDEDDIAVLAAAGASVVSNPSSNLRLASGIAPLIAMHRQGLNVGLGIDALGINDDEDMLQEMRLSWLLNRLPGKPDAALTAEQVMLMATRAGARATFWDDLVGAIEPGKRADLVLLDADRLFEPFRTPRLSVVEDILQLARRSHVDIVQVDGEAVVRGGQALRGSVAALSRSLADDYEAAVRADPRASGEHRRVCDAIKVHLKNYYAAWGELPGRAMYRYN